MRRRALQSLKRIIAIISVLLLIIMLVVLVRSLDLGTPTAEPVSTDESPAETITEAPKERTEITDESQNVDPPTVTPLEYLKNLPVQVALISGHANFDSGATCTDENGEVWLTEENVNAVITELVIAQLEAENLEVVTINEHDRRLYGLEASVLVSLHSDSCIDSSGYKAAYHKDSAIPGIEGRLLACINRFYPNATKQPLHPETITHDMTDYYAFRQIHPYTPAVILEMGFLGGDQTLLLETPELVASGVVESILCFLRGEGILEE